MSSLIAITIALALAGALVAYAGVRAQKPVLDAGEYLHSLDEEMGPTDEFERQIVMRVLERVQWNRSEASRILGIHRNSLKMKLKRWGVDVADDEG